MVDYCEAVMKAKSAPRRPPYLLTALFLLAAAAISAVAYRFHQTEKIVIENEVHNQLLGIADLKVRQLTDWRGERFGDASVLMSNKMMMPVLERILAGTAGAGERNQAIDWMTTICERLHYANAVLVNRQGKVVLRVGRPMGTARHFEEISQEVLQAGKPVFRDFHSDGKDDPIHLGINLPLARSVQSPAFGALLLGIDPDKHLYKLIESWPVPSRSAETLLARREGNEVVYLNRLRHRKDAAALTLRFPVTAAHLPVVQAALGGEGVVFGRDYRGIAVLAAVRRVPGTPWLLVAKIDADEVHAPVRRRSITLGVIVFLLVLALGSGVYHFWRRQQLRFYRERYQAEIERRALLGHYDYLTRFANDIILLADGEGYLIEANDRAVSTYGYSREELLGMPVRDLHHPSAVASLEGDWRRAAEQGGGIVETLHRRKDGSEFPVEVSMRFINVEGKKFYQSVIRDIRERKAMVEKLRETAATLNAIVDASPAAIIALASDGKVTLWNRAAERVFGYSAEDLLGHPLPARGAGLDEERNRLMRTLLAGESFGPIELRRPRKDGTMVDLSLSGAPLRDAQGAVVGVLGVLLDITGHKRAEREQRLLGEAVAASLNEVYLFDSDTLLFRYVNRGALENLGYTLAEMQRMTPLDIKPEVDRERFRKLIDPLVNGEAKVQNFETAHRRADSSLYPVEVHLQLFDHDGERVFLAIILDITERRRVQEALRRSEEQLLQSRKMEGIGRLAGGVAHDFNNYLTVINGYCDMLLGRLPERDPIREQVSHIRQAGEQAARLTHQLLAFSRRQLLEPLVLNLNHVVADTQRMLGRLIGEDIELVTVLDPRLGPVTADPGQMSQVLINLLVNARDAMPDGGKIIIETANVELDDDYCARHSEVTPGSYVMLVVSDTGSGMTPETLQRIFEPFYTTKDRGEGTGLGLATVYGIVRQSGGWIWVYSEPGRGTTFKLYLPRTGGVPQAAMEVHATGLARGTETVLVVEDQAEVRKLTASVLRDAGYQILEAADGEQALRHVESGSAHIHLLFTDVVMPGMTGRELALRVVARSPLTRVLYTSGYTANVIAHRGVLDEGVDYLPKPFTPNRLLGKIREILDRAPAPGSPGAL
jgi:two-component system, cell cycle sensor histidine kinase and response regulator CckA